MNRFTIKMALRYLFSKKSHSAVNVLSIVALCGVIVTSAACVCVMSVYNGFSELFQGKYAQFDPQLKVFPSEGKVIENADSVIKIIKSVKGVKVVMPTIEENALATYGKNQMAVKIKGIDATQFDSISKIKNLLMGSSQYILFDKETNTDFAILSIGSASTLLTPDVGYNDLIIYSPRRKGRVNIANPIGAFKSDTLGVSAVFKVDEHLYDSNYILVDMNVARQLFDYPTQASAIEIGLVPSVNDEELRYALQSVLGHNYIVKTRLMQQDTSFRLVNIEKWITFLLLGFIFIIATFNVVSSLAVLILEKDSSITTLRNLGATDHQISNIFLAEGWVINILGALGGIVLGVALCLIQQYTGVLKLSGDPNLMIINNYPVRVEWVDMFVIAGLVVIVGMLTSLATSVIMRHRLKK